MENSHWLEDDRSVITLTTADQDCVQARFAVFGYEIPKHVEEQRFSTTQHNIHDIYGELEFKLEFRE